MPLDNTLPFLVALRENYPFFDLNIITSDRKFIEILASETLIRQAIEKYQIKINAPRIGETKPRKITRLFNLASRMLVDSVKGPIYIINLAQIKKGARLFEFLMTINKAVKGGKLVELRLVPTTAKVDKFLREILNSQYGRSIEKKNDPKM